MHTFWLVLTYDLLEDRRIDDVIIKTFFLYIFFMLNHFPLYVQALELTNALIISQPLFQIHT